MFSVMGGWLFIWCSGCFKVWIWVFMAVFGSFVFLLWFERGRRRRGTVVVFSSDGVLSCPLYHLFLSLSLGDSVLVRFRRIWWSLFIFGFGRVLFAFFLEFAPEIRGGGGWGLAGRLRVEVCVMFCDGQIDEGGGLGVGVDYVCWVLELSTWIPW
jgi:hypothetical protein